MRISLSWLAEYVDLPAPEELARRLTAVGLEVEAIERLGAELQGIVAARIVSSEKHPNAEKLSITRVEAGSGEALQVVCGAKNYQVGDLVPLATVGTALPGGPRIERAKLRGVESHGMLCSAKELGIDADVSGLLILPRDTVPGAPVAKVLGLEDVVFEVNVTPNRPDCLSHIGIAREVAAITGATLKMPKPKLGEEGPTASEAVKVRIEAPDKCARYAARVVDGVKIGPSPGWLARRLEACGVRSISNVVDATNYVLLELGHPLHAFDLEKVAGREIVVRAARPGEKMITLDGKERALDPDDLVIADRDRASALAGVMGGGDSEISAGTSRVLLESAWFAPPGIRRTSKRHQLRSEASYRFERGADPGMVIPALDRCAALIAQLAGGTVRPGIVDAHPRPHRAPEVRLRWSRPEELLGQAVPPGETRRILVALGFDERRSDGEGATFAVPPWRQDVSREEDLIEEVVRTRGYDGIPETLPDAGAAGAAQADAVALARARETLEALGFVETINFSFIAPREQEPFGAAPIALANPITADLAVMRTSLVPALLKNLAHNLRNGAEGARFYELACVYHRRDDSDRDPPAREGRRLSGVLFGRSVPHGWAVTERAFDTTGKPVELDTTDFYDARAAVEALLEACGTHAAEYAPLGAAAGWLHPRSAASVALGASAVGRLGEIHPAVAEVFELPRGVFAFELDLDALLPAARPIAPYRPFSRFPFVTRDIAVVVDDAVPAAAVQRIVEEVAGGGLLENSTLYDQFRGAPLPPGKKNLAIYLRFRALDRTLTDDEADALCARIVERLRTDPAVRAELRG